MINMLASSSWTNTIELWDTNTGQLLKTLGGHTGIVSSIALSEDNILASGDLKGGINVWTLN